MRIKPFMKIMLACLLVSSTAIYAESYEYYEYGGDTSTNVSAEEDGGSDEGDSSYSYGGDDDSYSFGAAVDDEDEKGLEYHGELVNDLIMLHTFEGEELNYAGKYSLYLTVLNADRDKAKFEVDITLSLLHGIYAQQYYEALGSNESSLLNSSDAAAFLPSLRKLYLTYYFPFGDFTFGRQIVNFGTGFVFSPVDAFSEIDISEVSLRRSGSDIVMMRLFFPENKAFSMAGLDLLSTLSAKMDDVRSAAKLYSTIWNFDAALLGIHNAGADDMMFGLSFKGDLVVGLFGELVYHHLYGDDSQDEGYFEFMLGADYSFLNGDLILGIEYYFNEDELDGAEMSYEELISTSKKFFGRHYLFFSAELGIGEFTSLNGSVIWNVEEPALISSLQLSYNIFQNADMSLYLRHYYNQINGVDTFAGHDFEYAGRFSVSF